MPHRVRSYLFSPLAERDLEDIWIYTCQAWSRGQADEYHAGIIAAIEGLVSGAKVGREASEVRQGYKRYAVGRHILFFREHGDALHIIRILHQQMDLPVHLGATGI